MASKVTVLCPNGRRQFVKVSPNTSILEILEEACKKQGLDPSNFDISHYNKPLDLSLSVRFANLSNNALLELGPAKKIRSEGVITVALQLETGERLTGDFSPSACLTEIINTCLISSENSNVSEGEPVCIYMRQKFLGHQLHETTLRSLGLTSGKAILRLMYRQSDAFLEQAHISAPLPKPVYIDREHNENICHKHVADSPLAVEHSSPKQVRLDNDRIIQSNIESHQHLDDDYRRPVLEESPMVDNDDETMVCESIPSTVTVENNYGAHEAKIENSDEVMDVERNEFVADVKEIGSIIYIGPRNAVLFNLQDILEVKREEFSDDFFELTVNDVRYLMGELKKARDAMDNKPLLTRGLQQRELLKELKVYKQSVIRIYFTDQVVLQGTFIGSEKVQAVLDFVRGFLENPESDFHLYTTPPKYVLPAEQSLLELKLVPASVLHFGCNTPGGHILREDIRNKVSDPRAVSQAAAECRKKYADVEYSEENESIDETPSNQVIVSVISSSDNNQTSSFPRPSTNKTPAWFKFGKK